MAQALAASITLALLALLLQLSAPPPISASASVLVPSRTLQRPRQQEAWAYGCSLGLCGEGCKAIPCFGLSWKISTEPLKGRWPKAEVMWLLGWGFLHDQIIKLLAH